MKNIYNGVQNLYNMDKTTWQEVLSEFYNKVDEVNNKYDLLLNNLKDITLISENGTEFKIKVNNDGELFTEKITK